MPESPAKFYLTTPIYYVNARPHIGHAYSTIAADVLARRHRLLGEDTFFLTGTDEHGQKVQRSAEAAGIPPQQFTDEVSATFKALWDRMGITYNDYIRTTDERHKRGVQKLWKVLEEKGAIYLSSYTGQYCVSDEAFVDVPVGAPCPTCGRITETITEENYFFRLSEYQEKLIDLIESEDPNHRLIIQPETAKNEVLSFLRGDYHRVVIEHKRQATGVDLPAYTLDDFNECVAAGLLKLSAEGTTFVPGALKDLSISRTTFSWGIPVPDDPKHVVYVWLDALANYITAIGYGAEYRDDLTEEQKQAELAKFARYWPADIHLVGKEITRFHCVYWPAFLMAAGLPVQKSVVANGWLLFEESKMSKSRGNVVRTETILDAFGEHYRASLVKAGQPEPDKRGCDLFAADVLRYFLLREIPFGQDGSFSFDALITRYNADLANGYGNLVSRTLNLIHQNFQGIVPDDPTTSNNEWSYFQLVVPLIQEQYANVSLTQVCVNVANLISATDSSITKTAPWKLLKSEQAEDQEQAKSVLVGAYEAVRIITALLYPIMPHTTAKVWEQLGLGDIEEAARNGELKNLQWGGLKPGTKLGALAPIFPRADKGLAQTMTDMEAQNNPPKPASEPTAAAATSLAAPSTENAERTTDNADAPATDNLQPAAALADPPLAPQITIDDFAKVDLRVAKVLVAERIPKADKLLRLEVDLGFEKRQVLAGIAEYYTPEQLIGRKVVIVANLAPRKMRGLESNGMVVAASVGEQGAPVLVGFAEDVELGARLK